MMSEQVFTNCTNAGPVSVYVKDGKVTRMRALVADEKDFKPWVIEADGKKYSPPKKFNVAPYVHADRRRHTESSRKARDKDKLKHLQEIKARIKKNEKNKVVN